MITFCGQHGVTTDFVKDNSKYIINIAIVLDKLKGHWASSVKLKI